MNLYEFLRVGLLGFEECVCECIYVFLFIRYKDYMNIWLRGFV